MQFFHSFWFSVALRLAVLVQFLLGSVIQARSFIAHIAFLVDYSALAHIPIAMLNPAIKVGVLRLL